MASKSNSGTTPGKQLKNEAGKRSTSNLDRTLMDLESAFADWESLSTAKPRAATDSLPRKAASSAAKAAPTPQDEELRKKTKKLLKELRRQLSDLT